MYILRVLCVIAATVICSAGQLKGAESKSLSLDQLRNAVQAASRIRRCVSWQPSCLEPSNIDTLNEWLDRNAFSGSETAEQLLGVIPFVSLSSVSDASAATLVAGQVKLLDSHNQLGDLEALMALGNADRRQELQLRLERCRNRELLPSIRDILDRVSIKRVREITGLRDQPNYDWAREIKSDEAMASLLAWCIEFADTIERPGDNGRSLLDLYRFYQSIASLQQLRVADSTVFAKSNHRTRSCDTLSDFENCSSDFDIYWSDGGPGSQLNKTGVVLFGVPWMATSRNSPSINWSKSPSIRSSYQEDSLRRFLVSLGFPRKAILNRVHAVLDERGVTLQLDVSPQDFPDASVDFELDLTSNRRSDLTQDVRSFRDVFEKRILDESLKLKSLGGFKVKRVSLGELERSLDADLLGDAGRVFQVVGLIRWNGTLHWEPKLSLREKVALIEIMGKDKGAPPIPSIEDATPFLDIAEAKVGLRVVENDGDSSIVATMASTESDFDQQSPDDVQVVSGIVAELFPKLSRHLTAYTSAGITYFEIKIGDWPPLTLSMRSNKGSQKFKEQIRSLLSLESLQRVSKKSWNGVVHGRFGRVNGVLSDWDPNSTDGIIAVRWSIPSIGELGPLTESFNLDQRSWTNLDRDMLADDFRWLIKDQLLTRVDKLLGIDTTAILDIDPTGIEGTRWFDFHPLRISLKAKVKCDALAPLLPVGLQFRGIIVDAEGVHSPAEMGVILPDFPTPYFTVSEPTLAWGLKESAIGIKATVKPPLANVSDTIGDFAFAKLSAKQNFSQSLISANGSLGLVGVPDLAQVITRLDLEDGEFFGEARAGLRIPGFDNLPVRVGGRIEASPRINAFRVEAKARFFQGDIGKLSLIIGQENTVARIDHRSFEDVGCQIKGEITVPFIAGVKVDGEASRDLSRYTILGQGVAGPLSCKLRATEQEIAIDYEFRSVDGIFRWTVWSPEMLIKQDEARSRAEVTGLTINRLRQYGDDEIAWLGRREYGGAVSIASSNIVKPLGTELDLRESNVRTKGSGQFKQIPDVDLELRKDSDGAIIIVRKSLDEIVMRIPGLKWRREKRANNYAVWEDDAKNSLALFFQKDGREAFFYRNDSSRSLTDEGEFRQPSSLRRKYADLAQYGTQRCFKAKLIDSSLLKVESVQEDSEGRSLVTYSYYGAPERKIVSVGSYVRGSDGERTIGSTDIHTSFVELRLSPKTISTILEHRPNRDFVRLIYYDPASRSFGWYFSASPQDRRGVLRVSAGKNSQDFKFEVFPSVSKFEDFFEHANSFAQVVLVNPRLKSEKVFFGRLGALADIKNEDRFWLLIKRGRRTPTAFEISKSSFVEWSNRDTHNKLPGDWSTKHSRSSLSIREIANAALQGFTMNDRKAEPVNRLGLLISLESGGRVE